MRLASSVLLVVLLLAPSTAVASEPIPQPGTVWTVFTTVRAEVRDNYAVVKVIADIGNRGPDPEFPFVVRVPADAFVTGLTIERDGVVHEAEVKGREEARQQYEAWKAQEQTGALVEKARHTDVYSYLVNVAEFTSVRATLTYERYLAADRGLYDLSLEAPVPGFGEDLGARFEVTVRDSDGVVALWGEPGGRREGDLLVHEVGPRAGVEHPTPFTASYMLAPTGDGGSIQTTVRDGVGYFAHRFRAPNDEPQLPMDLVLVLDVSGSMAGMKLQQMIDAAKQVVGSLDAEDRLHLVAFSTDARAAWPGLLEMTPANRKRAAEEIAALFDGGGTNIEAGLRRGFDALGALDASAQEGRYPALVLLTDGQPTAGVTDRAELRAIARAANAHDVDVFTIAFGDDADWTLVRALADDADGAALRVPLGQGAEVDLRRFMAALTTPVLRDVEIAYGPGVTAYRTGAPVLLAGSELLVVGTFDPALGIAGNVTGVSTEGARRYAFAGGEPAALPFLPRLVAYHRVREMQESPTPDVEAIKALALEHSFVTDHTSFVLTLAAREFNGSLLAGDWRVEDQDAVSMRSYAPGSSDPAPAGRTWWNSALETLGLGGPGDDAYAEAHDAAQAAPTTAAPSPEAARVPAPGLALVALALAGVALLVRRRVG